jgi:hypothetical protein
MDATRYWSRFPGSFVNTLTGQYVQDLLPSGTEGPKFTGGPREWYETLVLVIEDCIADLQKAAFAMYGRAKRDEIHVYAHPDIGCVFEYSVLLKLPADNAEAPDGKSRAIGTIADFNIWADSTLSNDDVRVVATFDVDDGASKTMFGNIKILDMPENGRKA